MEFVLALLVIFMVGYLIVKKYQAQGALLLGGGILLILSVLLKGTPIIEKTVTGSVYLDIFAQLKLDFIKTTGNLGFTIMVVGAFAKYMDTIGASDSLVRFATKPLKKLNSPYVVLAFTYVIGQMLNIFIPSAAGLGVLLMVTIYPILVSLGVSPLAATAIIGTTGCLDLGPASGNAVLASKTANIDAALYFADYQIPIAIATVIVISTLHFIINKRMDNKLRLSGNFDMGAKVQDKEKKDVPLFYALLPIIPLVSILICSPLTGSKIRLGVIEGMFISITVSMIIEGTRRKSLKNTLTDLKIIFGAMGTQFANIISMVVAGQFFALGLTKIGFISTLIDSTKSAGLGAQAMIFVMTAIIIFSAVIMGSGNAPFFAFAALAPAAAASVGINPIIMLMPMQLSAGVARSMSPITSVIVAVTGISEVSPFDVVKRTAIPMIGGLITIFTMNMILFG